MECLLPYICMVTVPHIIMVGLERMLDYRGVTVFTVEHRLSECQLSEQVMRLLSQHFISNVCIILY